MICLNVGSILAIVPSFDRTNENVTVIIGNSAVLPCFISNLGDHKVAWIKVANTDVLAIGDYKVTNDERIKLVHGYVTDWSLSIQPVNEEDSGEYICQINTEPQMVTRINLQVLLPPKIVEEKSTISPEPIREGDTLVLYCHTEGIPKPKVSWYFRKRHHSHSNSATLNSDRSVAQQQQQQNGKQSASLPSPHHEQVLQEGDTLIIKNVSRYYSGVFECIANNSVPPAASRKIKVSVEFAPELRVQQEKVEQIVGQDARFECRIKANPLVNHYWMKDGRVIENGLTNLFDGAANHFKSGSDGETLKSSNKYEIVTYNQNSHEHLTISALIVKNVSKNDFGTYQCFAVNPHNISKIEVELKEIQVRRATSTTKAAVSRILVYNGVENNNNHKSHSNELNGLRLSTKPGVQSKQQRKTNSSSGRNSIDNDYFEHDLNENTLTLINSVETNLKSGSNVYQRFLLSICLFLLQLALF